MRHSACHAAVIAIAALTVWSAQARCNEVLNSTREQVTQTVRDNVRRQIQERERAAVYARHPREVAPR